jgi:hypothetical protein
MKTTMTTKAVFRPFAVGMSKKFLPLEVICYFLHPVAFDVLCPFVTIVSLRCEHPPVSSNVASHPRINAARPKTTSATQETE